MSFFVASKVQRQGGARFHRLDQQGRCERGEESGPLRVLLVVLYDRRLGGCLADCLGEAGVLK